MQRALAVRRRLRAAQRLAVDSDHFPRLSAQRSRPSRKATLQRLGVQQPKHLAQSLRRRDAVGERQEGAQPVQRPDRDLLHPFPVVRPAHHANQRRQQHFVQGIGHHPRNPVVGNNPHMIQKPKRHGVILSRPFQSNLVNQPLTI